MRTFVQWIAGLAALLAAVAAPAQPIPLETLFRKPQYGSALLSPNGRYLAVLTSVNDRLNLAVVDVDERKSHAATALRDADVVSFFWVNDDRLVVRLGEIDRASGEPPRVSSIVAVDRDGGNARDLRRGFMRGNTVSVLRAIPGTDQVYVTAAERVAKHADLYRVDTRTGNRELLSMQTPDHVSQWVLDLAGVPRAMVTANLDDDRTAWYFRKDAGSPWQLGAESKMGAALSAPVAFGPDGRTLYVSSRKADRATIHEFDTATGTMGEPFLQHPERDVRGGFVIDPYSQKLLGYRYVDDRPSVAWFDETYARMQKGVDAALPDTVNVIAKARQGERWLVTTMSDRDPGSAYLLDGKTFKLEKVLDYQPAIKPAEMAATKWVRYSARDGRIIPAMLTLPRDAAGKRVPLVVQIHGGPYVPATQWGFDPEIQFFASRGYAVLQPQFRGTDGFGAKHLSSGFRQWGLAMQDDLVDGVAWAVKEGLADPARVCYFGGSYGGFAALNGAFRDRDVIKCAVAFVAVSGIDTFFDISYSDNAQYMERSANVRVRIGDPATDREKWKRVNPKDNADKFGVPVLLAYGLEDRRVPLRHGDDMRSALDRHQKPYEWVTYAGEGHGFRKTENVIDFHRRVEAFLAKHLGGN